MDLIQQSLRTARKGGAAALRRGRAAARRARTAAASRIGPGAAPDLQAQLDFANSEVDRLRALVHKTRRERDRLRAENQLRITRESTANPLPRPSLPPETEELITRVRAEHLTLLSPRELDVLARLVRQACVDGVDGLIVEAGTARGGSAIVMASVKDPERPMKVYDVFGQIPPPSEADGGDVQKRYETIAKGGAKGRDGETYYGYRDNLYGEVMDSFAHHGVPIDEHNVELVKGLFEDTIQLDEPVAFAHLDGDWYESTLTCLERIAPLLVPGGRIVLDDYFFWSGCRTAVDEYFADRPGYRIEIRDKVHVVRL